MRTDAMCGFRRNGGHARNPCAAVTRLTARRSRPGIGSPSCVPGPPGTDRDTILAPFVPVKRPHRTSRTPPNLAATRHSAASPPPAQTTARPPFRAPAEPLPLAPLSATRSTPSRPHPAANAPPPAPAPPPRAPSPRAPSGSTPDPGSPPTADAAHRNGGTATRRSRRPAPAAPPTNTAAALGAVPLAHAERKRDGAAVPAPPHRRCPRALRSRCAPAAPARSHSATRRTPSRPHPAANAPPPVPAPSPRAPSPRAPSGSPPTADPAHRRRISRS